MRKMQEKKNLKKVIREIERSLKKGNEEKRSVNVQ